MLYICIGGGLHMCIDTLIIDDMQYYIYGIKNSTGIYYIGKTRDIKQRTRQHKYLGRDGTLEVLATCPIEDAKQLERYYIHKYKDTITNKRERYYSGIDGADIIRNR